MTRTIDLNADLGEGQGFDAQLMGIISSASIACGGHAGNQETMCSTLLLAKQAKIVAGAHPGFMDKKNFGRVRLNIAPAIVARQVVAQVKIITEIADNIDHPIRYIKLHGALYNWASQDEGFARTIFAALKTSFAHLAIMALDNSVQLHVAQDMGLKTIAEAFVDRRYTDQALLVDRSKRGAVIEVPETALKQALGIVLNNSIISEGGVILSSHAQSLCLHGDNVAALELAHAVSKGVQGAGVEIKAAL